MFMWHVCGRGEVRTEFWWETEGESALGRCGHRWEGNCEMDIVEMEWGWSRFIWLRMGASVGLL